MSDSDDVCGCDQSMALAEEVERLRRERDKAKSAGEACERDAVAQARRAKAAEAKLARVRALRDEMARGEVQVIHAFWALTEALGDES